MVYAGAEVEYRKQLFDFDSTIAKKPSAGINVYFHTANPRIEC
jgi:hypothetical protein